MLNKEVSSIHKCEINCCGKFIALSNALCYRLIHECAQKFDYFPVFRANQNYRNLFKQILHATIHPNTRELYGYPIEFNHLLRGLSCCHTFLWINCI